MSDSTIEKIKKLLRLGKSSNPHEAELALQRAFQIAEKNNIDLAALDVEDDLKKIARHAHRVGWRLSYSRKRAMDIVRRFFNVTPVIHYPHLDFVGTASEVEVAIYVFEFLTRACNRALLQARREHHRRKISRNAMICFVNGFFYGVAKNLNHAREETLTAHSQYALVLQSEEDRRQQFIAGNMRTTTVNLQLNGRRNPDALMQGHRAGLEVQINKPLPTAERFQLCAGAA